MEIAEIIETGMFPDGSAAGRRLTEAARTVVAPAVLRAEDVSFGVDLQARPAGIGGILRIMSDQQGRQPLCAGMLEDETAKACTQGDIQLCEGLVEQQGPAVPTAGCAAGPRGPADRPTGWPGRGRRTRPCRPLPGPPSMRVTPLPCRSRRLGRQAEGQVPGDGEVRKQTGRPGTGCRCAAPPAACPPTSAPFRRMRPAAAEGRDPGSRRCSAKQAGLPAAARAHHRDHLAGRHRKAERDRECAWLPWQTSTWLQIQDHSSLG